MAFCPTRFISICHFSLPFRPNQFKQHEQTIFHPYSSPCCSFPHKRFHRKQKKDEPKKEEPKHYLDTLGLGLSWRSVGPAVTSGRIGDFAVHPKNRAVYYVATASGGVWKTTNAGTTYEPIFDGEGSYSIGCVVLDPNNPSTVWVGTGENNNQRSVAYGDGVYRSNDGGKSWSNMGLKNSEHIAKMSLSSQLGRGLCCCARPALAGRRRTGRL
ncbi:MAG: hypothetical protein IPN76_22765 [Saprospiraceae bacterium]|nr:hypothetical protein [Saprospiraceae bacterium]